MLRFTRLNLVASLCLVGAVITLANCSIVTRSSSDKPSSPGHDFNRHSASWVTGNSYKDLSRYLTQKTHSNELVENIKVAEPLAAPEVARLLGSKVTELVRALISLVPLDRNMDQEGLARFCGAQNLANLRVLIEAMRRKCSAPTREPENKKRLNLLLIKSAADVRSYCYEYLQARWLGSEMINQLQGFELLHHEELPTDLLLRQQLDSRKNPSAIKFVGQMGKLLLATADHLDERELAHSQPVEEQLQKPCHELTESEIGRNVLAPAVDLMSIGLIVFDRFNLGKFDERRHRIKPLGSYLMCRRLLGQSKRKTKQFARKLGKVLLSNQRESRRQRTD